MLFSLGGLRLHLPYSEQVFEHRIGTEGAQDLCVVAMLANGPQHIHLVADRHINHCDTITIRRIKYVVGLQQVLSLVGT